jgi:hypothetical protein
MPLRNYLAAIAIFCNEVKGKSALALSRDLDVQYKTAYVLAHKLREAMASELKGLHLGGAGETVEVDGGYFGGYVKPANHKENRRDRRLAKNQNGKRQVVVVMRERGGSTLPAVFKSESAALGFIAARVAKETRLMADEASSWKRVLAAGAEGGLSSYFPPWLGSRPSCRAVSFSRRSDRVSFDTFAPAPHATRRKIVTTRKR